jgi:hypothetical protein
MKEKNMFDLQLPPFTASNEQYQQLKCRTKEDWDFLIYCELFKKQLHPRIDDLVEEEDAKKAKFYTSSLKSLIDPVYNSLEIQNKALQKLFERSDDQDSEKLCSESSETSTTALLSLEIPVAQSTNSISAVAGTSSESVKSRKSVLEKFLNDCDQPGVVCPGFHQHRQQRCGRSPAHQQLLRKGNIVRAICISGKRRSRRISHGN